jgi:hypothetical protein
MDRATPDAMPSLFVFLVAYAGIGGQNSGTIDGQIEKMLRAETEVVEVKLDRDERKALVEDGTDAAKIIEDAGARGLVAGVVVRSGKQAVLKLVVFDAEGTRVDLVELPFGKKKTKKIGKADLSSLKDTLGPTIAQLTAPPPAPEPVVAETADTEVPDAVVAETTVGPRRPRESKLKVAVGFGPRTRTFVPGPTMTRGYDSSPVPSAQIGVTVRPIKYAEIGGEFERTLVMNSDIDGTSVPSSILGWQLVGAGRLALGPIELAALAGVGGREFVIDSADPAPTPDGHYLYALLGGRVSAKVGSRVELRVFAAFQPVIGGDDTMSAVDPARNGVELGGAVEVAATRWLFALAEAGYQRFTWTLDDGTATDTYPSGTFSLGAKY